MRPLAVDLYCGLSGWGEGLVKEGFRVEGVDIENMFAILDEPMPDHFELLLADVRSIHGSRYKDAKLLVGGSPCTDFSYRAMPWKRARALTGPFLGMLLFWEQFRIQREASEAAGHYIPMIVENVRGAQAWVGKAKWNCGSMYFWGDVPALMPRYKHIKVQSFRFDGSGGSFQNAAVRSQWFNDGPRTPQSISSSGSGSPQRKAASARIAKIPLEISSHIARVYKP